MSIKEKTIERFVTQLINLGCQLKVITPEGTEYGDLVVTLPRKRGPYVRVLPYIDYKTAVDNLKVGDVAELDCPEAITLDSLQSSLSSYGSKLYGMGSIVTARRKGTRILEVLRVE
jgi:hypothetical protein